MAVATENFSEIALRYLLVTCRELQALLKNDPALFRTNDFSAISRSNQQKLQLIDKITRCINETGQVKIELENLSVVQQTLVIELRTVLQACQAQLQDNSQTIFSGVRLLKEVIDRLRSMTLNTDKTYDVNGRM